MDINACVLDLQRAVYEAGTKEGQRWNVNTEDLLAVLSKHLPAADAKPKKGKGKTEEAPTDATDSA